MSKTVYVYSTLATDTAYTEWREGGADLPVPGRAIVIKGGTGVANKNFITPMGVVTKITEEELSVLKENKVFQMHEQNGFIRYSYAQTDPEKVATKDMATRDNSAPIVPQDYSEDPESPGAKPDAGTRSGKKKVN